jgi:aldose 1-epimerase
MADIELKAAGDTRARIAPDAGFCCLSFSCEGNEYLRLPESEPAFRRDLKTGGIPLLYPFANRLRSDPWTGKSLVKHDDNGLPIHGFLLRFAAWDRLECTESRATASLHWGAHEDLMALFPHEHTLEVTYTLSHRCLRVETVVQANSSVPISFGWHPYLQFPNAMRDELSIETPELAEVVLDAQGLPQRDADGTLRQEPPRTQSGPLAERAFDTLFRRESLDNTFTFRTPERAIEVMFDGDWPFVQLFSPPHETFFCIEPMTAPVAALSDANACNVLRTGERFTAAFEVRVL